MIEGILASTVGEDDVTLLGTTRCKLVPWHLVRATARHCCSKPKLGPRDELVDYFMGMPNAYLPFLINKDTARALQHWTLL